MDYTFVCHYNVSCAIIEIMLFQDDELEEPLQKLKMGKLHCVRVEIILSQCMCTVCTCIIIVL